MFFLKKNCTFNKLLTFKFSNHEKTLLQSEKKSL